MELNVSTNGRFHCYPQNSDESDLLNFVCIGSNKHKEHSYWSVEDTLFNRLILGLRTDKFTNDVVYKSTDSRLREYQIDDIQKMLSTRHTLNRNKMGYGKTVEAVKYCEAREARRVLVIAPKIVLHQWAKELKQWWDFANDDNIFIRPTHITKDADQIVLVNYEKMIQPKYLQQLKMFCWDVVILDEAHRIKNRESMRTRSAKSIPTKHKVALTGTPVLNRPDDLWSLLNWFDDYYSSKSYWNFVNAFCKQEDTFWGNKIIGLTTDKDRIKLLNDTLSMISIYNDDLHLTQGKLIIPIDIEMGTKQQKLYDNVKKLVLDQLPECVSVVNGLSQVIRLQQVTSNCGKFDISDNPKFNWIRDLLDDNPYDKIVVFSKFAETVVALNNFLKAGGDVEVATIHGGIDDREAEKEMFINDPKCRVITGTLGAMGVGVDGLQHASSIVVFLDRDWSPAINEQAEDRVNRSGQPNMVKVYLLNAIKSIDSKVGVMLMKKIEDIRKVLNTK